MGPIVIWSDAIKILCGGGVGTKKCSKQAMRKWRQGHERTRFCKCSRADALSLSHLLPQLLLTDVLSLPSSPLTLVFAIAIEMPIATPNPMPAAVM